MRAAERKMFATTTDRKHRLRRTIVTFYSTPTTLLLDLRNGKRLYRHCCFRRRTLRDKVAIAKRQHCNQRDVCVSGNQVDKRFHYEIS